MLRNITITIWFLGVVTAFVLGITPDVMVIDGQEDKVLHLAIFCFLALGPMLFLQSRKMIFYSFAALFSMGILVEVIQMQVPGRNTEFLDLLSNTGGILIGGFAGYLIRSGKHHPFHTICFILICLLPFQKSMAQEAADPEKIVSVRQQIATNNAPLGVRVGTFLLYPGLEVGRAYDSNVYKTATDEKSDFTTVVQPSFYGKSDWGRNEVSVVFLGRYDFYSQETSEDSEDYLARIGGRYDIFHETYLEAYAQTQKLHEDRFSPDDVGSDEPTTFTVDTVAADFVRALGRLKLTVGGKVQDVTYDDATRNGTFIDNSTRNRDVVTGQMRLAYELKPGYDMFIEGKSNRRHYDLRGSADRSSDGYEVVGGYAIDFSGKTKGEVYLGYFNQDYSNNFNDIDEFTYGGSLLWNVSGLATVNTSIKRNVYETSAGGTIGGYVRTASALSIEHALARHLLIELMTKYDNDDFIGITNNGATREDQTLRYGGGMIYYLNRRVILNADYEYRRRESDAPNADYDAHQGLISVNVRF